MTVLRLNGLTVNMHDRTVLRDISLQVDAGEFVGLIGPNGAGKTTLMRAALDLIPFTGHSNLAELSARQRARTVAWMPQSREIAWPVTVETVVSLGRLAHGRAGTPDDQALVDAALDRMDLADLRHRPATQLSGGEQARVLIARALAQDTALLMADEPTAGLDPAHQIATMQTFAALAVEGKSVITSIHDLGLAARHCSRLILLGKHQLIADGRPSQVLTAKNLADVFGISAWLQDSDNGLLCQPLEVVE